MADDKDLDGLLPKPPPPDGDRRSATISAALRQFDAHGRAPGDATEPASVPARGKLARPQLAVLASAMLVVLVALPVLLTRGEDLSRISGNEEAATQSADIHAAAPASVQREKRDLRIAATTPAGEQVEAPVLSVRPAEPRKPDASEGASEKVVANSDELEAPSALSTSEVLADRRASEAARTKAPDAPAIAPAPPPPPQAERRAEAQVTDRSIVVTGSRVEVGPANLIGKSKSRLRPSSSQLRRWRTCTLADPQENTARCDKEATPGSAELMRGLDHAFRGNDEAALRAFDAAIALAPQSIGGYLNRSLLYQRKGDADAALGDLNRAIRVAPSDARGYYFRSLLLREDGDVENADEDLETALQLENVNDLAEASPAASSIYPMFSTRGSNRFVLSLTFAFEGIASGSCPLD